MVYNYEKCRHKTDCNCRTAGSNDLYCHNDYQNSNPNAGLYSPWGWLCAVMRHRTRPLGKRACRRHCLICCRHSFQYCTGCCRNPYLHSSPACTFKDTRCTGLVGNVKRSPYRRTLIRLSGTPHMETESILKEHSSRFYNSTLFNRSPLLYCPFHSLA